MRKLILLGLILLAGEAHAAISAVGSLATANEKTSDADFAFTTSATLEAGNLAVCDFATDNIATTDGVSSNHTSVTDGSSNSWIKLYEITESSGAAGDGNTISSFYTVASTQLTSGGTITLNLSGSLTAKAGTCHEFTIGTSSVKSWLFYEKAGSASVATCSLAGSSVGDDTNSVIAASREYLSLQVHGIEIDSSTFTATANYTAFTHTSSQTSGGTDTTNVAVRGQYRILTYPTVTAVTGNLTAPTCSHTATSVTSFNVELHEYSGGWDAVRILGSASGTSSATISITLPAYVGVPVGHVPVVIGAADNDGNGTDTDDYNSPACSNSGTNATWTNIGMNEADPGAANAGAAVVLCTVHDGVTTAIAAGATITVTAASSRGALAATAWDFFVPDGDTTALVGTEQKEDSTSQAGSLTVSSIAAGDLCIRGIAEETNSTTTDLTLTASFTRFDENGTTGGGAASNMTVLGEWIISTGTSCASDPATPNNGDQASSMTAIRRTTAVAAQDDSPSQVIN